MATDKPVALDPNKSTESQIDTTDVKKGEKPPRAEGDRAKRYKESGFQKDRMLDAATGRSVVTK